MIANKNDNTPEKLNKGRNRQKSFHNQQFLKVDSDQYNCVIKPIRQTQID